MHVIGQKSVHQGRFTINDARKISTVRAKSASDPIKENAMPKGSYMALEGVLKYRAAPICRGPPWTAFFCTPGLETSGNWRTLFKGPLP